MIARAVEEADSRLHDLREEELQDGALAAVALVLSLIATSVRPELALPLFVGAIFVGVRAVVAGWRRWDLIDRLVSEPDAQTIADVRERAESLARMSNRRSLSHEIRRLIEDRGNPRVTAVEDDLAALADELADQALDLDPACAAACAHLLTDGFASPLINPELPAEDVRSRVAQVRAGFHPARTERGALDAIDQRRGN